MLGLLSELTIQSNDAIITKVSVGNLKLGWHLLRNRHMGGNMALLSRAQTKWQAYNPSAVAVGLLINIV